MIIFEQVISLTTLCNAFLTILYTRQCCGATIITTTVERKKDLYAAGKLYNRQGRIFPFQRNPYMNVLSLIILEIQHIPRVLNPIVLKIKLKMFSFCNV